MFFLFGGSCLSSSEQVNKCILYQLANTTLALFDRLFCHLFQLILWDFFRSFHQQSQYMNEFALQYINLIYSVYITNVSFNNCLELIIQTYILNSVLKALYFLYQWETLEMFKCVKQISFRRIPNHEISHSNSCFSMSANPHHIRSSNTR